MNMEAIAPGTPCFLVHLVERKELNGRVVEVAGPAPTQTDDTQPWYQLRAAWVSERFPDNEAIAPRRNLRPIVPPSIAPTDAKERTPELVR
jgi:hypothetical protein